MAKTDWQMGDIVQPEDMNQIGQEINDAATAVASAQGDIDAHKADTMPHASVKGVVNFGFSSAQTLQISNGAITINRTNHVIDTEGGASSDELETINGGNVGDFLILRQADTSRKVTIKGNGQGNIFTFDRSDVALDSLTSAVMLYQYTAGYWIVLGVQGVKRSGDTMTGHLNLIGDNQYRMIRITNDNLDGSTYEARFDMNAQGEYTRLLRFKNGVADGELTIRSSTDIRFSNHPVWYAGNMPYETGTWTPELQFGGSSTGILYSVQTGRYTLVGNVVNCEVEIELANKGSQTGVARIVGLPFASSPTAPRRGFVFGRVTNINFPQNVITMNGLVTNSSTAINLDFTINNDTFAQATNNHFSSNSILRAAFQYWKA